MFIVNQEENIKTKNITESITFESEFLSSLVFKTGWKGIPILYIVIPVHLFVHDVLHNIHSLTIKQVYVKL